MNKLPINKFQYLEMLVVKIKLLHAEKKNYDWYFEELIDLYKPLIQITTKKVFNKFKTNITMAEIKLKVIELFFDSIVRYNPDFTDKEKENKNNDFTYVWFSKYLKRRLPWEMMRISKPPKIERDDLQVDKRNIELDLKKPAIESKLQYNPTNENPISDNFISLARMAQRDLQDDLIADLMLLKFGYDYKNNEINKFLGISEIEVSMNLNKLKIYWEYNIDFLT